jgi:hypothetical protein
MLKRFITPKSWDKMMPDYEIVATSQWALERTGQKERG